MADIQENKHLSVRDFFVSLVEVGRIKSTEMTEKALTSLEKSREGKSLYVAELSETILEVWIDGIIPKLSLSTVTRYVESIQKIYKYALQCGVADNEHMFERVKRYVQLVSVDGGDRIAKQKLDVIRQMTSGARLGNDGVSIAIDVYLYSFFNAGLAIDDVVAMRLEHEKSGCMMPHTARIVEKYKAPKRRYVFPLEQSQRTPKKIREELDRGFKCALKSYKVAFDDKTAQEYVVSAWISAAKACGVGADDICACCKLAANYPRFKDIKPSELSQKQIDAIKQKVANSIIDMDCHWYAARFAGDFEKVSEDIKKVAAKSYAMPYYPMNKIVRKINGKIKAEERPVIHNVMFLYTMPRVLVNVINNEVVKTSRLRVFTKSPIRKDDFAIIPNEQMKRFSLLVSNGLPIFAEDSIKQSEIELGNYVQITEGMFQGYSGRVIKAGIDSDKKVTMLQIKAETFGREMEQALGQHLYITIPEDLVNKIEKNA